MGLNDRIVGKVMDNYIPKLIAVIESMHAQMEMQNRQLTEIWKALDRKADVDERICEIKRDIEEGTDAC